MFARHFIDSLDFARNGKELSGVVPLAEMRRLQDVLAETDDLRLVSELLGHQNKTITEQYLAVHQTSDRKDIENRN